MRLEDEKLEQFTNDIMANVAVERQKVLSGVDKDIESKYKEKETQFYSEAYEHIQDGMKLIDKEKNEIVSKALMENKIRLFQKRTEIIDDIFDTVRHKLKDFCKEEGYYQYLVKMIKKGLAQLESGNPEIIINYSDKHYKESLEKEFKLTVNIEIKQIDFLGGCKILDRDDQLFIDDSFESKLLEQKEEFIKSCKIVVE